MGSIRTGPDSAAKISNLSSSGFQISELGNEHSSLKDNQSEENPLKEIGQVQLDGKYIPSVAKGHRSADKCGLESDGKSNFEKEAGRQNGDNSDCSFLDNLRKLLLKGESNFPLKIQIHDVDVSLDNIGDAVFDPETNEMSFSTKSSADNVIPGLIEDNLSFSFDYSEFISHPGNLFIKNLSGDLIDKDKLQIYFNDNSKYKSFESINIFNGADDDIFAIIRFSNYLDVDYLIGNLDVDVNPFNENKNIPLYLNKYISKKERKMKHCDSSNQGDSLNNYCSVIIENLNEFLNDHKPDAKMLQNFFSKFEIFNNIEDIYVPILSEDSTNYEVFKFGFINFESNDTMHINVLKSLYYLNDLTFDEFMNFTENDVYNLEDDIGKAPVTGSLKATRLKISIAQHKHNHLLYQYQTNQTLKFENKAILVKYLDAPAFNQAISKFSRYINYQETNIYVNNLPIIFENNDNLWEQFWSGFGSEIKSAKIIKPQFYTKKNEMEIGKIGFVFYKDFKIALRAILLTNNKIFNYLDNHKIFVQTSFAIQKNNHSQKNSISSGLFPPEQNDYPRRFSMPAMSEYNYYLSPPTPTFAALSPPAFAIPQSSPDFRNYYPYVFPVGYSYYNDLKRDEPGAENESQAPVMNYGYFPYYQFSQSIPVPAHGVPTQAYNFKTTEKINKNRK